MKLDYLESFLAISKYKSISQAAQSLYITQPTLTNRMKNLESYLGLKLFNRSWEGAKLTEHGLQFLPKVLKIFNKLDDFHDLSKSFKNLHNDSYLKSIDEKTSAFNIGINHYLVPKYATFIVQSLLHEFPNVKFEFTTAPTKELLQKYTYGLLDYIVYYDIGVTLPNTELITYEKMSIALNEPDYLSVKHDLNALKQINKPLFMNSDPSLNKNLPYFESFRKLIQTDNVVLIKNITLIKILIQNGKGFTILPDSVYGINHEGEDIYKLHIPKSISKLPIHSTYSTNNENHVTYSSHLNGVLRSIKQTI